MCSGATPTCLHLPCQSCRDVAKDRTCATEKGLRLIQMDILRTETLLPSSTPRPLPSSCYHSPRGKSRLTAGSANASGPLGLPLSIPSCFTSAATQTPHPSLRRCDTAVKLAENKNVTYGTHLPPGKNLSGNEVRRMVSREQCPWTHFQLGIVFAIFFFKSEKLFQIKSLKKKKSLHPQRS